MNFNLDKEQNPLVESMIINVTCKEGSQSNNIDMIKINEQISSNKEEMK